MKFSFYLFDLNLLKIIKKALLLKYVNINNKITILLIHDITSRIQGKQ